MKTETVQKYTLEGDERAAFLLKGRNAHDVDVTFVANVDISEAIQALVRFVENMDGIDLRDFIRGGYEPTPVRVKCHADGCKANLDTMLRKWDETKTVQVVEHPHEPTPLMVQCYVKGCKAEVDGSFVEWDDDRLDQWDFFDGKWGCPRHEASWA